MDIQMPVMDGHTAARRLHEVSPGLPIIGLTAHAMEEERDKCLASGMVEHVAKPIEPDILVDAICVMPGGGMARVRMNSQVNNSALFW